MLNSANNDLYVGSPEFGASFTFCKRDVISIVTRIFGHVRDDLSRQMWRVTTIHNLFLLVAQDL